MKWCGGAPCRSESWQQRIWDGGHNIGSSLLIIATPTAPFCCCLLVVVGVLNGDGILIVWEGGREGARDCSDPCLRIVIEK